MVVLHVALKVLIRHCWEMEWLQRTLIIAFAQLSIARSFAFQKLLLVSVGREHMDHRGNPGKIRNPVELQRDLDLSPYVSKVLPSEQLGLSVPYPVDAGADYNYTLVGVIRFIEDRLGSDQTRSQVLHYITFLDLSPPDSKEAKWVEFDDMKEQPRPGDPFKKMQDEFVSRIFAFERGHC